MRCILLQLLPVAGLLISSLHSLVIDTHNQAIPASKSDRVVNCTFKVFAPNASESDDSYNATIKQQGRADAIRPGYFLTTWSWTSILGLPNHTTWVLKSLTADRSLVRDAVAFEIARSTGEYASRTRFVELYLAADFQGVYILEEKVAPGPERVSLGEGGYLLKLDTDNYLFNLSVTHSPIEVEFPDPVNRTEVISGLMNSFESLLLGDRWLSSEGYRQSVNSTNWANYFLLTEFARSSEAYIQDVYFFIPNAATPKILLGPAWDYNIAFGNGDPSMPFARVEGWHYESLISNSSAQHGLARWYYRALADATFQLAVGERWRSLRQGALSDDRLQQIVNQLATDLNQSTVRVQGLMWAEWAEAVHDLSQWLADRAHWMDTNLLFPHELAFGPGSLCEGSCAPNSPCMAGCGPGTVESSDTNCSRTPVVAPFCAEALENMSLSNQSRCSLLLALSLSNPMCPLPLRCSLVSTSWECHPPQSVTSSPSRESSIVPSSAPSLVPSQSSNAPSKSPHSPSSPVAPTVVESVENAEDKNTSAIVIGTFGAILLVIALGYICFRRRRKSRPIRADSFSYDPVSMHSMGSYDNMRAHLDEPMLASFDSTSEFAAPLR